jgi:hypothetical protein
MTRTPLSDNDPHILLQMRSTTPRIPQIQGISRLKLKSPQQLHKHFVQLHKSNRLAQTLIFAMPKGEIVVPLHFLQTVG